MVHSFRQEYLIAFGLETKSWEVLSTLLHRQLLSAVTVPGLIMKIETDVYSLSVDIQQGAAMIIK